MDEQRKIIYNEIEKSQSEILNLINSYDTKIHQLFAMIATSTVLLLAFSTFLINLFLNSDLEINYQLSVIFAVLSALFFIVSLICLIYSLHPCLNALKERKIAIINPTKFYQEYGTHSEKKLIEFLIIQTSSHFEVNKGTLDNIHKLYDKAINRFRFGIASLIVFVTLSLITILFCG